MEHPPRAGTREEEEQELDRLRGGEECAQRWDVQGGRRAPHLGLLRTQHLDFMKRTDGECATVGAADRVGRARHRMEERHLPEGLAHADGEDGGSVTGLGCREEHFGGASEEDADEGGLLAAL